MTGHSPSHRADLIEAGVLHVEDLETNRAGHLSGRQKRRLSLQLALWSAAASCAVLVFALLAYFHLVIRNSFSLLLFDLAVCLLPLYLCARRIPPLWRDVKAGAAQSAAGTVFKRSSKAAGTVSDPGDTILRSCTIVIEDQIFSVSPLVYDHLVREAPYRVYYVSNTRKLINVEPL